MLQGVSEGKITVDEAVTKQHVEEMEEIQKQMAEKETEYDEVLDKYPFIAKTGHV